MSRSDINTYTCKSGETFDSIALLLYENERYAYELMAANPVLCRIMVFDGGEVLTIPELAISNQEYESTAASEIAPWKG